MADPAAVGLASFVARAARSELAELAAQGLGTNGERARRVHSQRYNLRVVASIEEFSYELTAAALREQERSVTALRTRAGTVLAAASVSGSFLATKVNHGSLDVWAVLALVAFAACVGAAIYVLLPHRLVFGFRGQTLLAVSDHEGVDDLTEAYRAAGIWIEPILESNRNKIADLADWFTVSCGLLTAEVILWTVSLAG